MAGADGGLTTTPAGGVRVATTGSAAGAPGPTSFTTCGEYSNAATIGVAAYLEIV